MTKIEYMIKELALEGVDVTEADVKQVLNGDYESQDDYVVECIIDMESEWGDDA